MNLMRLTLIHNQSRATYYTHDYHVRFHTSQVSLMIRCYNRYIRENFTHHHTHHTRTQIMPYKDVKRESSRTQGTYDFYIEIDCDCEELLDACDLTYTESETDETQNEVALHLTRAEFTDVLDQSVLSMTNEQTIATALLNAELGEYTTKGTVYTPYGDKITFE